jgi:hypothetical protein
MQMYPFLDANGKLFQSALLVPERFIDIAKHRYKRELLTHYVPIANRSECVAKVILYVHEDFMSYHRASRLFAIQEYCKDALPWLFTFGTRMVEGI